MATSGPWAGIAEDLTQTSSYKENVSDSPRKALTSALCGLAPYLLVRECANAPCARSHVCEGRVFVLKR
jgi:hypothetical protein